MIKRFASILMLAVIALTLIAVPVLASTITGAEFKGDVTITNASTAATNVSVPFTLSTANFITDGYINSACTNTSMQIGGADTAYMPGYGANPWIVFTPSIALNGNIISKLYTGGPAMDGKIRYFPDTAGLTTNDAAALELGNNFEVELSGYYDTSSTTWLYPFNKADAFGIVTINGYIGAIIRDFTEILSQTSRSSVYNCYGNTWRGQTFTASSTTYLSRVFIYANPFNSPTDLTLHIRATEGGLPTGPDLVTVVNSTLSSFIELPRPFLMTEGEVYAFAISCTGNGSNYMNTEYMNKNQYAGGQLVYSTNGGSSWTAVSTYDYNFALYTSPYVSYAGTSGDYAVKVTADATDLKLYVDGTERDSIALDGASVPNNASNYVCFANSSMPYVDYLKITVGGTLQQHIEWQYAATLTDQSGQGNNPASVSFRTTSSDADVSAALTSFVPASVSSSTTTPGTSVEFITTPDLPVISDFPQMYTEGETGGFVIDDMYNPHLAAVGIPQAVFWYPIAFLIAIIAGFGAFLLTKELIVQAVVSAVVMAGFCGGGVLGDGLIPYWTVIVFIFEAGMLILIKEHQRI